MSQHQATGRIPAALAQALAPFAPPDSSVHDDLREHFNAQQIDQLVEAASVRADLHINCLKSRGELRRREDARALADQIAWGVA